MVEYLSTLKSKYYSVFCEYNFMNEFIYLNSQGSRVISIQIIQSFSLLILNISNPMTIYFLFSNNFINQIISQDYTKYDDEFIAYYINFIKSLSLKIDTTTIQFFFHEQHNSFPLIQSSIKFYNHPDSMIRTTVRNIFLTFLKLKFQPIYEYFTKLPSISYFSFLVINLRDLVIKLNDETLSDDFKNLKDINDDILDIIMYFQDIFSLKIKKINNILINCIFYYIVFPLLIAPITSLNKVILLI
jgi:protein CLEC16A